MVIAANDISQCRETLFYPLDLDVVGQGIPQMLQFLVCGCCGDKEAVAVSIRLLTSFFLSSCFQREKAYPTVRRPIIRVPAIVAWQMGMTSWSSASKTLFPLAPFT